MEEVRDEKFVLMPWNDTAKIIKKYGEQQKGEYRWNIVKEKLQSHIPDVETLIQIIRSYNFTYNEDGSQSTPSWSFKALKQVIDSMEPKTKEEFFKDEGVLHSMQHLVLKLPDVCPQIPWLATGCQFEITLHQVQIACILANAFFCTFPRRGKNQPSINFNTLFEGGKWGAAPTHVEKLKCIVHYFVRIHQRQPTGWLTFSRRCMSHDEFPRWERISSNLSLLTVCVDGLIEDQDNCLQLDFANRVIGGGVLGRGCVQEEIRFAICPELIAARLFTQPLADNEALLIDGAERFCKYSGYADTFCFQGNHEDVTPMDTQQRRCTRVVAVDALNFRHPQEQYREGRILREVKKMYVGLAPVTGEPAQPLATGNWGCGAYRGDPQLKALVQLVAASRAGRSVRYFTFSNHQLQAELTRVHAHLTELSITIGQLYRILTRYVKDRNSSRESVFAFVMRSSSEYVIVKNLKTRPLFHSPGAMNNSQSSGPASAYDSAHKRLNGNEREIANKQLKRDERESHPWPRFWIEKDISREKEGGLDPHNAKASPILLIEDNDEVPFSPGHEGASSSHTQLSTDSILDIMEETELPDFPTPQQSCLDKVDRGIMAIQNKRLQQTKMDIFLKK